MEKFKLKVEARQFFSESYAKEIQEMKFWERLGIPKQLLDEVDNVYIEYGHKKQLSKDAKAINLCGWSGTKNEAEFLFTIKIKDISNFAYSKVDVPKLMDEMQKVVSKFFKPLLNDEN
jgi:hypothetical protein